MEQTKSFTKFWVRSAKDFSLLLSANINQNKFEDVKTKRQLNMVTLTRQTICGNPNLLFQTQNQKRKAQAQNRWKQRLPFFEFDEDLGLTPALSFWLPVAGPLSSPSSSSEPCERRNKQYLDYQNQKSKEQSFENPNHLLLDHRCPGNCHGKYWNSLSDPLPIIIQYHIST